MDDKKLTERQKRERDYYNVFSSEYDNCISVNFEPVLGKERRDFNSYWSVFHFASDHFSPNARLLDFGCGPGVYTLCFSRLGYEVHGFDISDKNVELAKALAKEHSYEKTTFLKQGTAESLSYQDNFFDVIVGVDILHHVDIPAAMKECFRVLKPGGKAIFSEPLYSTVFDTIRNLSFVKRVFPNSTSYEKHITEDERKLGKEDLQIIRDLFPSIKITSYLGLARLDKFFPLPGSVLEKVDYTLFRYVPVFRALAGAGCIILEKE